MPYKDKETRNKKERENRAAKKTATQSADQANQQQLKAKKEKEQQQSRESSKRYRLKKKAEQAASNMMSTSTSNNTAEAPGQGRGPGRVTFASVSTSSSTPTSISSNAAPSAPIETQYIQKQYNLTVMIDGGTLEKRVENFKVDEKGDGAVAVTFTVEFSHDESSPAKMQTTEKKTEVVVKKETMAKQTKTSASSASASASASSKASASASATSSAASSATSSASLIDNDIQSAPASDLVAATKMRKASSASSASATSSALLINNESQSAPASASASDLVAAPKGYPTDASEPTHFTVKSEAFKALKEKKGDEFLLKLSPSELFNFFKDRFQGYRITTTSKRSFTNWKRNHPLTKLASRSVVDDDTVSEFAKFSATDRVFKKIVKDSGYHEIVQLTALQFFKKYGKKFPKCVETFSDNSCKVRACNAFSAWKSRQAAVDTDTAKSIKGDDEASEDSLLAFSPDPPELQNQEALRCANQKRLQSSSKKKSRKSAMSASNKAPTSTKTQFLGPNNVVPAGTVLQAEAMGSIIGENHGNVAQVNGNHCVGINHGELTMKTYNNCTIVRQREVMNCFTAQEIMLRLNKDQLDAVMLSLKEGYIPRELTPILQDIDGIYQLLPFLSSCSEDMLTNLIDSCVGEGYATYEPARKEVETTSSSEPTSASSQSVLKNSTNTPSTTTTTENKTV